MQKESELQDGKIPMIMLTHDVKEKKINIAIEKIEALSEIEGKVVRIRAEHFSD